MNRQHSLLRASILSLSLLTAAGAAAEASSTSEKEKPKAAASEKGKSDKAAVVQGKYKYAGPKSEKEVIKKQVDDIVWKADESIRMMAQESLNKKTHIPEWVDVKQSGTKVTIHAEGRKVEVHSTEKTTDGMDPDGNPSQLQLKKDGNVLTQTVTTAEGARINKFTPQPDGSLKLDVEIQSPRLPTPIKYSLTYKK
jgi:hypothetical protein